MEGANECLRREQTAMWAMKDSRNSSKAKVVSEVMVPLHPVAAYKS